jgi:hypothetical protein
MKRVLLSLCLIGAVVYVPTTLHFTRASSLGADDAMKKAITRNVSPASSTIIVGLQSEPGVVHSVVVDMPQVISLSYASPETWGSLPTTVRPYEQPPATGPVRELAMK